MSEATSSAAGFVRRRRPTRRVVAGSALLLVAAGAIVAVTIAFRGRGASGADASGNPDATSLATVVRRPLSSQTPVTGTLGYAGSSTIAAPAGTTPADLLKAQEAVAFARSALQAAQVTLAADEQTLADAQAKLAADRRKLASDCAGTGAAGAADSSGNGAGASPCATAAQAVATDEQAVNAAEPKVATDTSQVGADRMTLSGAQQTLATAESSALAFDASATYTRLPAAGSVIRRGGTLYAIADRPVLLLYGPVTAWRGFRAGMPAGRDVAELNANLRALGDGGDGGNVFTGATARAIAALQAAHGLPRTGELPLGSVVFTPGPVRVKTVSATVGATVQPGPVLGVSSTRHEVTIALDAAQQSEVKVGDKVTVTLPDNSTTGGVVASVGSVATPGNQGSSPTIDVHIRLTNQSAAGDLVQAPVNVSITTASIENALVVPVNALLALAGGGYAVETVDGAGVHRLVPVSLGLFSDADGLVEVTGTGLKAGDRVVVPA